jgi:hypothetical protein
MSRAPRAFALTIFLVAVVAAALLPSAAGAQDRYDNTWMKDFMMDAPWRVKNAGTAIPLTIILKDCDADDIRQLHWIRCWDVTGGGEVMLWNHDFGDEQIGNDVYEHNFWTYITTVTEGHPTLPDGTLLTPSNLGHGTGDAIQLKMSVYYRDDIFNYTETRYLRVHVAPAGYPWPTGWYGGDTHFHTMYTNNIAEYGAPVPAVAMTGEAMGLSWLTTTDHSCDLDETGDGSFSYATTHWEYTIQDQTGSHTVYRNNTSFGSSWNALGDDVSTFDSPAFRIYRGVEINLASIDSDTYNKTLHCLFYNEAYISSPLSGALGERPVTPSLPDGIAQLSGTGFAYAAHPLSDLGAEWGGIDWTVNGAMWGDEDLDYAVGQDAFRGLEAFNTRPTRFSSDQMNPWNDFDAGETPDGAYPQELLQGISTWDGLIADGLDPLHKTFLAGGSDAHGDFNYAPTLSLDSYATDNAIGKVQTVAHVPGPYGPGSLPPIGEILAAYRAGHTVVTDGPFVMLGVDATGDNDLDDPDDLIVGEDGTWDANDALPIVLTWASTTEFGQIAEVKLVGIDAGGAVTLALFDPRMTSQGYGGATVIEFPPESFDGMRAFRVECSTGATGDDFRAYANPVWVEFDATDVAHGDGEARLALAARANPSPGAAALTFTLPSAGHATLGLYDIRGRIVRTLVDGVLAAGAHETAWDGTDRSGNAVASGVYFATLRHGGETATSRIVLLR